ncbi:hypothetical protein [Wenyingzhuangia sp. IMCC45574]
MKTNIKIFASLLLAFCFITSCSTEDVTLYGDTSEMGGDYASFKWYSSGTDETERVSEKFINLNDYLAFYDISFGVKSRNWEIPTSGRFLNKEFGETDSIYTSFIIPDAGTTSSESLINVLFTEPGTYDVKLTTTFNTEVNYSKEINGEEKQFTGKVVDTIFKVKVFEDPNPEFKIYRQNYITNPADPTGPTILDEGNPYSEILHVTADENPSEEDIDSWLEISIEAAEKLQFEDLSTAGEVDARRWTLGGGKPEISGGELVEITYNKLTEGDDFYTATIQSRRTNTVGPVKNVTKLIPLKIKVLPSTKPFEYKSGLKVSGNGTISFPVSGEVESFAGQEGKFTVHVTNTDAGFDQDIAVESISLKDGDATVIELKLAEPVYNTDTFTVSYTDDNLDDENGILSVDGRSLASFDPVTRIISFADYEGIMNINDYTGYESEYGGSGNQFKLANMNQGLFWAQHNANKEAGPLYYWRDTDLAYEGNSSLKFETPATGIPNLARLQGSAFKTISPVSPGKYIPSVWVYIDPATNMTNFQYNFTDKVEATFNFDISSVEKGKWVLLTLPAVDLPTINAGRMDVNVTKTGQDDAIVQKLWLDNFDLLIVNDRP